MTTWFVWVCLCVYLEAREEVRCHSSDIHFIFLGTELFPGLELAKLPGWLASPRDQSASASPVLAFLRGSGDWTQVLMLTRQAHYWLCYLCSPWLPFSKLFFLNFESLPLLRKTILYLHSRVRSACEESHFPTQLISVCILTKSPEMFSAWTEDSLLRSILSDSGSFYFTGYVPLCCSPG